MNKFKFLSRRHKLKQFSLKIVLFVNSPLYFVLFLVQHVESQGRFLSQLVFRLVTNN